VITEYLQSSKSEGRVNGDVFSFNPTMKAALGVPEGKRALANTAESGQVSKGKIVADGI